MIMRGLKLQKAIQLAAEERLTESEMATYLDVSPGTLSKLNRDPIFIRRVGQERAFLRLERSAAPRRGGKQNSQALFTCCARRKIRVRSRLLNHGV
jgi:hypothetical protein